jgi:hypothetical protein
MKALQKFIQLSLILVITLTSMGFRVKIEECHGHRENRITFLGSPDCCCEKSDKESKTPYKACSDLTCIVQANIHNENKINGATEQSSPKLKAGPLYQLYTQVIRPVLQEKIPHFTLPPPSYSGRFIGILHQTFII